MLDRARVVALLRVVVARPVPHPQRGAGFFELGQHQLHRIVGELRRELFLALDPLQPVGESLCALGAAVDQRQREVEVSELVEQHLEDPAPAEAEF